MERGRSEVEGGREGRGRASEGAPSRPRGACGSRWARLGGGARKRALTPPPRPPPPRSPPLPRSDQGLTSIPTSRRMTSNRADARSRAVRAAEVEGTEATERKGRAERKMRRGRGVGERVRGAALYRGRWAVVRRRPAVVTPTRRWLIDARRLWAQRAGRAGPMAAAVAPRGRSSNTRRGRGERARGHAAFSRPQTGSPRCEGWAPLKPRPTYPGACSRAGWSSPAG